MAQYGFRFILYFYFLHLRRIWEYNIKKNDPPFPSVIQIQTINQCNGSCFMCPNSKIKNKKVEIMSDKLFEKIISEIINEEKSATMIFMYLQNEPLMDENLFKKIRLIKDQSKGKIITGILTNGSLFTEKKIKELENSGNDFISFSLDALTKETYNKIRSGFDFEDVLENLDQVLNSKINSEHIDVEFAVQKKNIHEFNNFKKFWKKKVGGIIVNYLTNRSGDLSNFNDICLDKKDISLLVRFKFILLRKILNYCTKPFASFNILSNGDVICCPEDYDRKMALGNVQESSIKDIWKNEKYRTIRDLIHKKKYSEILLCSNCSMWRDGYLKLF